jgi:uncharacterized protein (DUF1330 family)
MPAICMLNALWFKPDGGAQRYAEYGEAVAPLLEGVGAEMLLPPLPVLQTLEGDFDPDLILLVRYPSEDAFNNMWRTDAYSKIAHLRTEAITKAVLTRCAMDPEDAPAVTELPAGIVLFEALTFTDGGSRHYDEYASGTAPLMASHGGGLLTPRLMPQKSFADEFLPDLVILGHFPSLEAMRDVAGTPEYPELAKIRGQAVAQGAAVICQGRA